jgi:hypothetical protein
MRRLIGILFLIAGIFPTGTGILAFPAEASIIPLQSSPQAAQAADRSGEFKTAFVISDKDAKVVIDLFSSAVDSVDDATDENSREKETDSAVAGDVEIENVEDLDIKPGDQRSRNLDQNR